MLLKWMDSKTFKALQQKSRPDTVDTSWLDSQDVRIVYSYDEEETEFLYEAFDHDGHYASFSLSLSGTVSLSNEGNREKFENGLKLLTKIKAVEDPLTESEISHLYPRYYPRFAKYIHLSRAQTQQYLLYERDFSELLAELRKKRKNENQRSYGFMMTITDIGVDHYEYRPRYQFSFVVQVNRKHRFASLSTLIGALDKEKVGGDGKNLTYQMIKENFTSQDQKTIGILRKLCQQEENYAASREQIPDEKNLLTDLIASQSGKKIGFLSLEDKDTVEYDVVESKTPLALSVDEKGKLSISTDLDQFDFVFHNDRFAIFFSARDHKALVYPLPDSSTVPLLDFLLSHRDFPYQFFHNEIVKEFIPLVEKNVSIDPSIQDESNKYRSEIIFYLTYDQETDTLDCHSEYLDNGKKLSEKEYAAIYPESASAFSKALKELSLIPEGTIKDGDVIYMILTKADFGKLDSLVNLRLSDNLRNITFKPLSSFSIQTESGIDWFKARLTSKDYTPEEVQKILSAYKRKRKYIRLQDSYLDLTGADALTLLDTVNELDLLDQESAQLPLYQALKLSAKKEEGMDVSLSTELTQMLNDVTGYQKAEVNLSPRFLSVLRPYQLAGVKWLYELYRYRLAGILADDMGLGKTLETIAFLSLLDNNGPILIVSPKSLIFNWEAEFAKWDPEKKVHVLAGSKTERSLLIGKMKDSQDIFVTSYDSLRNDIDLYEKIPFYYVILDEAQYIANALAMKTKAIKKLNSLYRLALTGTPIQNSLLDLWSIFDFLLPGYLPSFKNFKSKYGDLTLQDSEDKKRLSLMILPFILRRKKEEVLKDLPPKSEEVLTLEMSDKEKELYDAYLKKAKETAALSVNGKGKLQVLSALGRLRQICVDASSFLVNFTEVSSKLDAALTLIETAIANGHKLLIFSSYKTVLDHLEKLLNKLHIQSASITGETNAKKRIALADDFNQPESRIKVMLISLKAGGTGLNLVGADIVVHLDPWWNVAAETQAEDRAHRIGQSRPVTVYKMIEKDSIEERVLELQKKKANLNEIIRDSSQESGMALSDEDIQYLLS